MSKAALLELADRVEKASGPDTELDARVWCAVFAPADAHVEKSPFNGAWCIYLSRDPSRLRLWESRNSRVLPITSSLDAAMALVPKGWWLDIKTGTQKHAPDFQWPVVSIGPQSGDAATWKGQAATLALTITAAALRARAQQESKDDGSF